MRHALYLNGMSWRRLECLFGLYSDLRCTTDENGNFYACQERMLPINRSQILAILIFSGSFKAMRCTFLSIKGNQNCLRLSATYSSAISRHRRDPRFRSETLFFCPRWKANGWKMAVANSIWVAPRIVLLQDTTESTSFWSNSLLTTFDERNGKDLQGFLLSLSLSEAASRRILAGWVLARTAGWPASSAFLWSILAEACLTIFGSCVTLRFLFRVSAFSDRFLSRLNILSVAIRPQRKACRENCQNAINSELHDGELTPTWLSCCFWSVASGTAKDVFGLHNDLQW